MAISTEWAKGYVACLQDLRHLLGSRDLLNTKVEQCLEDMEGDAVSIDHEIFNREQRRLLRIKKEIQLDLSL